jgi:dipeptidyl aminopeptidase/acylaminoacyl peptidase
VVTLLGAPALLGAMAALASPSPADCHRQLSPVTATGEPRRPVSARDLVGLRDFGSVYGRASDVPPFRLSPDRRHAVLTLRRGDPDSDTYCFGVIIISLDASAPPLIVDSGGSPILETSDLRGLAGLPMGNILAETPHWSPNGRWIAYRRRDEGVTRLWRASADASGARPIAVLADDARIIKWSSDGSAVIVGVRPGLAAAKAAIAREEKDGFLFGRRFWPLSSPRPFPPDGLPEIEQAVRIDSEAGATSPSPAASRIDVPNDPVGEVRAASGAMAWTAAEDPGLLLAPRPLHVRHHGRTMICRSHLCRDGVDALWWQTNDRLMFVRHGTADNGGATIVARWDVGRDPEPASVLVTPDTLEFCVAHGDGAVCSHERAAHPRSLIRVSANGVITTLFDPNPEFAALAMGQVRRLSWRLRDGAASFGDLVLPPDHRPGDRHPLIIVQYRSRGFLRGGTGDEYPIHAFAARGFAVLSVERPAHVGAGKARSLAALLAMGSAGFAERRRLLASIEAGVTAAVATGAVDGARIGITGLSDGAASVQFALLHSQRFSAAAVSTCCDEPSGQFVADHGYADQLIAMGYPQSVPGTGGDFWRDMSLAANAERIRTPLLMQLTSDEFRLALESYTALDRAAAPVEMYVFADGYHLKYRPAHRLAVYTRALDWFDFWLRDRVDPDSAKAAQYDRWRTLAARRPR